MRVLIIDDELDGDSSRVDLLRREGFDVVVVNRAAAVKEVLARDGATFDVIILDIMLPPETYSAELTDGGRFTGVAVLPEIRAACPNTPVVVVSAHRASDVVNRLDGIYAFLEKPVKAGFLAETLREAMRRR